MLSELNNICGDGGPRKLTEAKIEQNITENWNLSEKLTHWDLASGPPSHMSRWLN